MLRADADEHRGMGHVTRCVALAQAWQHGGGSATLVTARMTTRLRQFLRANEIRAVLLRSSSATRQDALETCSIARRLGSNWVVVDGYHLGDPFERTVRTLGIRVFAIDDFGHASHINADVVLNQNPWARASLYARSRAALLIGPQYALLRREFRAIKRRRRTVSKLNKILVMAGGGDHTGFAVAAVEALRDVISDKAEIAVIAGPVQQHDAALRAALQGAAFAWQVIRSTSHMAQWMNWADFAVSAAGSVCWEMAFMGLPALVAATAPNQEPCVRFLSRDGSAVGAGRSDGSLKQRLRRRLQQVLDSPERLTTVSQAGRRLLDGKGADRAAAQLKSHA